LGADSSNNQLNKVQGVIRGILQDKGRISLKTTIMTSQSSLVVSQGVRECKGTVRSGGGNQTKHGEKKKGRCYKVASICENAKEGKCYKKG
jgi:hypothetical protein